jgi:hypothetical protein
LWSGTTTLLSIQLEKSVDVQAMAGQYPVEGRLDAEKSRKAFADQP